MWDPKQFFEGLLQRQEIVLISFYSLLVLFCLPIRKKCLGFSKKNDDDHLVKIFEKSANFSLFLKILRIRMVFDKGPFINYVSGQRGEVGCWKMLTLADKGGIGGKANADIG